MLPTTKTDFLSALGAVLKQKSALNAWQHRSKTNGDQSVPRTKHIDTSQSPRTGEAEGSEARDVSGLLTHPYYGVRCAAVISRTAGL